MTRKTTPTRVLLGIGALSMLVGAMARPARACSEPDPETVLIGERHPDQPLEGFMEGRLGVLRAGYARTYLIVAYRYLAGLPLDRVEQQAALKVICDRQPALVCTRPRSLAKNAVTDAPGQADQSATLGWWAARRAALGPSAVDPTYTAGAVVAGQYGSATNCLDDAFRTAEKTLAARVRTHGAGSAPVKDWIVRQDAVFTNCDSKVPVAVPPPAAAAVAADPQARFDHAYQTAAAAFYARDYAGAETAFRRIAADAASPWRTIARYLVARTLLRRAETNQSPSVVTGLTAAKRELEQTLADPTFAAVHPAARLYMPIVRAQLERAELTTELGVRLGRGKLGSELAPVLANYAFLHGDMSEPAPQAKDAPPESDRLAMFIHVIRAGDFARAAHLWEKTRSEVWLVAALMAADSSPVASGSSGAGVNADEGGAGTRSPRRQTALRDAEIKRLDAIVAAAAAVPPSSPAFFTAQYYRLSLRPDAASLAEVRTRVRPADGPSTHNAFQELAVRNAPNLDALLADALAQPAGQEDDETGVLDQGLGSHGGAPSEAPRPSLMPLAADAFARALPMALLAEAARSRRGAAPGLAPVIAAAYVRACLLDDRSSAAALADPVKRRAPAMAPFVDRIEAAASPFERRFEVVYLLAKMPGLSFDPAAWVEAPPGLDEMRHTGGWWWCRGGLPPASWSSEGTETPEPPPRLPFLTDPQRAAAASERQRLERLGAGPNFVATALLDVAPKLPDSDRLAEALSIAVAGGRYACRDAGTTKASKRAFTLLHKRFPRSPWAKRTPHYY